MFSNLVQNILRHLGGIQQYGIVSLCLFVAVFTGVFIWAFTRPKGHLDYMARVALDPDPEPSPRTAVRSTPQPSSPQPHP